MQVKIERLKNSFYDYRLGADGVYAKDLLAYAQQNLGAVRMWHCSRDNMYVTNAKNKRAVIRVKLVDILDGRCYTVNN